MAGRLAALLAQAPELPQPEQRPPGSAVAGRRRRLPARRSPERRGPRMRTPSLQHAAKSPATNCSTRHARWTRLRAASHA
eukprot:8401989-Alexandrium_andersonii.AAC.1